MMTQNPQLIHHLLTRGVAQILPHEESLAKLMTERPIKLYLGIDPTGALLHLGHAVVLRKLQQFADLGHEVILLIGNGTVKIGDPTGHDESRPMLTDGEIEKNWQNWKKQASPILDFETIKIMYNGDWLEQLNYAEMIKLLAKTTVQQLLERDMFQERLAAGKPIHGHEIIYPLLQGYDSVAMDVDLELGGSDQTFNMLMGRTLQKIYRQKEKWVLTTPIINGTDGRKMSKSYQNFVALTESPDQMYGKLMSVQDEQIVEYLTLLTDVSDKQIEELKISLEQGDNPKEHKMFMAHTITAQLHSKELADQAQQIFIQTFQNREIPDKLPQVHLSSSALTVLEILKHCKPSESSTQLKRLCVQNAVRLMPSNQILTDPVQPFEITEPQIIKIGKRDYFQLHPPTPTTAKK